MKKNFLKGFVAVAAVALMTACSGNSLDSKISKFEKACNEGNVEEAMKIADDLEKNYEEADFSEEQLERLEKASMKLYK